MLVSPLAIFAGLDLRLLVCGGSCCVGSLMLASLRWVLTIGVLTDCAPEVQTPTACVPVLCTWGTDVRVLTACVPGVLTSGYRRLVCLGY